MRKTLTIIAIVLVAAAFSCSDEDSELVRLRVDHYQKPYIGLFQPYLSYMVQFEGTTTGSWEAFGNPIEGFNYESGKIYDLLVRKEHLDNPPQDGSSVRYSLVNVISIQPVDPSTTFEFLINPVGVPAEDKFIRKTASGDFVLVGTVPIDCGDLCALLDEKLQGDILCTGKFVHGENHSIKLIELK